MAQAAWGRWSAEGKDGGDNDGEGEGEVAMLLADVVERVGGAVRAGCRRGRGGGNGPDSTICMYWYPTQDTMSQLCVGGVPASDSGYPVLKLRVPTSIL